jgi:DNA polymerase-3 subunit gamma/tau
MSYVVLARKYRPRNFEEMVGQDHVVRALTHALEQQRLHHAYLFTGTRGIGKTTVSRILAKSLNCIGADGQGGITARPCGVCSACREIDADRYIDYVEMDAASNRSIDEIRELIERAAYKPTVGRFKVFMIDEAHQLTKDAFNALLKTLEEPPEYLKFVLATTDPEKMLPTVLSRCLQFNLRPMAPATVAEHLARVLEAESVPVEAGALRLLSRAARGSMRDGLSLADQAIAYGGGALQEAGVRAMLGSVDRRHAERLIEALAGRDGIAVLEECEALRTQGLSAAGTLEEMARLLQQMAVAQAVPGALDATDPDAEAAIRLQSCLASDETQLLYSMCLQGRAELGLAPDEYAGLVMALLRFLAFPADGAPRGVTPPAAVAPQAAAVSAPGVSTAAAVSRPSSAGPGAAAPLLARRAEHLAVQPPAPPRSSPTLPPGKAQLGADPGAAAGLSAGPGLARPASQQVSQQAPEGAPEKAPEKAPEQAPPPAWPPRPRQPSAPPTALPESSVDGLSAQEPPPWMDDAPFADDAQAPDPQAHPGLAAAAAVSEEVQPSPVSAQAPSRHIVAPALARALPIAVTRTALGDRWAALVAELNTQGAVVALARELAMQAELTAVAPPGQPAVWQLTVGRESLRTAALVDKLQAALRPLVGPELQLQVSPGVAQDSPARRDAEAAALRQEEAENLIQNDPAVMAILSQFSTARLLPGSIKPV